MSLEKIAKIAGVSKATVSRVINNSSSVKFETRQKILKIMEENNYTPNISARVLAGAKTNIIGIFIVSLGDEEVNDNNKVGRNDFYMQFLNDAFSECTSHNHFVLTSIIKHVSDTHKIKEILLQKRIDLAIIIGMNDELHTVFEMISEGYPLVIFDFDYKMAKGFKTHKSRTFILNYDDYISSYNMLEYLYDNGHKNIGAITGNDDTYSGKIRKKAYMDFCNEYNLKINDQWLINGEFMYKTAYEKINEFCNDGKELPTAFYAFNDGMAIGAIKALQENNISVPEDISVVGYDNIVLSEISNPRLTTVSLSFKDMIKYALEKVININDDEVGFVKVKYFEGSIIMRDSVKNIN